MAHGYLRKAREDSTQASASGFNQMIKEPGPRIAFQYIQPGKPEQNAYVERVNRMVRFEWLQPYYWQDLEMKFETKPPDGSLVL